MAYLSSQRGNKIRQPWMLVSGFHCSSRERRVNEFGSRSLGFHKQVLFCFKSLTSSRVINQSITDKSASAGTVTSSSQSIVPSVSCRVLNPGLRNRGCRSTDRPGPSQSPVSYLPTGSSSDHVEFRVISFIWPAFNLFITRAAHEYLGKHSFSGADPTSRN